MSKVSVVRSKPDRKVMGYINPTGSVYILSNSGEALVFFGHRGVRERPSLTAKEMASERGLFEPIYEGDQVTVTL